MAVSVDTVYQKVLALANKEQRGYITPQEYNLLANQAQLLIFEQYFYDISQEMSGITNGNDTEYSDKINILNEKIAPFQTKSNPLNYDPFNDRYTLPSPHHKIGTVSYHPPNFPYAVEVEEVRENELLYINSSPIARPTLNRPVYVQINDEKIKVFPNMATLIPNPPGGTAHISTTYIVKPYQVIWGYTVVNSQALYDATTSTDYELHPSEESELIYKVLELAGIILNKPGLVQVVSSEETAFINQKK